MEVYQAVPEDHVKGNQLRHLVEDMLTKMVLEVEMEEGLEADTEAETEPQGQRLD